MTALDQAAGAQPLEIDLEDILAGQRIATHFQPLVSIKNRSVIGLEALSRGSLDQGRVMVPPSLLFSMAASQKDRLALDRLCRQKALERFAPLHQAKGDLLLSLNLDVRVLYRSIVGSGHLLGAVRELGINPHTIIIEVLESQVKDETALADFIAAYRAHGFLIALDDVGAGHSNLDRIPKYKPDIIKIDRELISGVDREYHKAEITKSLVRLAHNIGAMAVAEGVERIEEVVTLMELGVDIFQGYFFCKPRPFEAPRFPFLPKVMRAAETFKTHIVAAITAKKLLHKHYDIVLGNTVAGLACCPPEHFDLALADAVSAHPDLECLYILDRDGMQVSSSICNPEKISESRRFIYHPAPKGADHSLKDYYLPIAAGLRKYTTEPYISLASGNLCTTIASTFTGADQAAYILCVDLSQRSMGVAPSSVHSAAPDPPATSRPSAALRALKAPPGPDQG